MNYAIVNLRKIKDRKFTFKQFSLSILWLFVLIVFLISYTEHQRKELKGLLDSCISAAHLNSKRAEKTISSLKTKNAEKTKEIAILKEKLRSVN